MLKLEYGKCYKTKSGELFGPMEPNNSKQKHIFPFKWSNYSWTADGKEYNDSVSSHIDLVEEVQMPSGHKSAAIPAENKADKLMKATQSVIAQESAMILAQATVARIRKASYDAHIEAGFTKEQALDLCKQLTM